MKGMEKDEKIAAGKRQRRNLLLAILISALVAGILVMQNGGTSSSQHLQRKQKNHIVTEQELVEKVKNFDQLVRNIKATGVFMEVDPKGVDASKKLQEATRQLLHMRYGSEGPYRVRVNLEFQPTISDFQEKGADGSFLIEMAPIDLVPHSVFTFMEIARHWSGGAFHRRAGHVLQVMVQRPPVKHLAFQEYSKEFPHEKGTVGYAGRPSGPAWYVSIQNNTRNHGPGSQQKKNPYEADSCFGRVIEGFDDVVVGRITKMGGAKGMGFINDAKQHVKIKSMQILVPGGGPDGYVGWKQE